MLKKGDVILIVSILILSAAGLKGLSFYKNMQSSNTDKIAVIKHNNSIVKEVNLEEVQQPLEIKISGEYKQVILVEKGKIRFKESDCPNEICVKTGWLTQEGDTAVCIPNHTIIIIQGKQQEVDGIAY